MIARLAGYAAAHSPFRFNAVFAGDWRAGCVSAFVMLPQAVVLATLAGMPPEMGIYASVFPVIVAALFGSSPRLLSGPNTAVALMLTAALTPFATPLSSHYIVMALTLTAMVGLAQLLGAALRLGRLFDAMPNTIVHGVTFGVGLVIVITQLPVMLGILPVHGEAPWVSLWHAIAGTSRLNPYAVAVTVFSIVAALTICRRHLRGALLLVALVAGTALAYAIDGYSGVETTNLERVGYMTLSLLPVSFPEFSWDQTYVLKQLVVSAVAIAVIGALQTVIIARSISSDGTTTDPNRELLAQGLSNTVASLTSGFAGSGSFNRSAAHVHAGARTPWAAVLSAIILFALVLGAGRLFAYVPVAAMAGALMLVGWGLLRSTPLKALGARNKSSMWATLAVGTMVVTAGLETAVLWACAGGVGVLIWRRATHRQQVKQPEAETATQPLAESQAKAKAFKQAGRPRPVLIMPFTDCNNRALQLHLASHPNLYAAASLNVGELVPLLPRYGDLADDRNYFQLIVDVIGLRAISQAGRDGEVFDPIEIFDVIKHRPRSIHAIEWTLLFETGRRRQASVVMDDSLGSVHYADTLASLYSDMRFVHVVRDPRVEVQSMNRAIARERDSLLNAVAWKNAQIAVDRLIEQHPDRVLTIRYEDFVADRDTVLAKVFAFIGLDPTAATLEAIAKTRLPVDAKTQPLSAEEIEMIETVTGEWMDRYGYARRTDGKARITERMITAARRMSEERAQAAWAALDKEDFKQYTLHMARAEYLRMISKRSHVQPSGGPLSPVVLGGGLPAGIPGGRNRTH